MSRLTISDFGCIGDHGPLEFGKPTGRILEDTLVVDLMQFYKVGLSHPNAAIRGQFQKSVSVATQAIRESASDTLVSTALLFYPCHMLAARSFNPLPWTSDMLIESGTLDWVIDTFGEEIAEIIRLQPHINRYLASVNQRYRQRMGATDLRQFHSDGGEMSLNSKIAFARGRYFSQAMQLARWINQSLDQNWLALDINGNRSIWN